MSVAFKIPSLLDATITDLSEGLKTQRYTSVQLVHVYLARIAQVNNYHHAVIETNPSALSIAKSLDEEREARGRQRSSLYILHIFTCYIDALIAFQ